MRREKKKETSERGRAGEYGIYAGRWKYTKKEKHFLKREMQQCKKKEDKREKDWMEGKDIYIK